ncbi:MAG: maleylacetoacetate isomerase [Kofleriaceae bacterium]
MSGYRLHGYWRSGATYRVRIALGLKQLGWETVPINLLAPAGGAHLSASYRATNPQAQVPTLELPDGRRLTQSLAIIEFLEEAHPAPALLPSDRYLRARTRALAEVVNSGIQPLHNLTVARRLKAAGVDDAAWAKDVVTTGLTAFAALLADVAGTCCVGDAPSLADVLLVPQLYSARRYGVDLATLPRLTAIEAHLHDHHPAFAAAHPDRQPDAVAS